MRIVSGGVQHETNTFSTTPTTLADFVRDSNCGPDLSGGETIGLIYVFLSGTPYHLPKDAALLLSSFVR